MLNNVLCGKMNELWKGAEIANENSKWMLNAFEEGRQTLDEKEIVRYKNRVYETLDDEAKDNIIKIAKIDIANLLGAMKPAKKEMLLYRTIWCDKAERYGLPRYDVDDIVEFKIISSTATAPFMENKVEPDVPYADWLNGNLEREFYRYVIKQSMDIFNAFSDPRMQNIFQQLK